MSRSLARVRAWIFLALATVLIVVKIAGLPIDPALIFGCLIMGRIEAQAGWGTAVVEIVFDRVTATSRTEERP